MHVALVMLEGMRDLDAHYVVNLLCNFEVPESTPEQNWQRTGDKAIIGIGVLRFVNSNHKS